MIVRPRAGVPRTQADTYKTLKTHTYTHAQKLTPNNHNRSGGVYI